MSVIYSCRHCGQKIGEVDHEFIDTSMLGFDDLTAEEKREMVRYDQNGDIYVAAICDECYETLSEHPQYHELDYFIQ
jgi:hypothetical protein